MRSKLEVLIIVWLMILQNHNNTQAQLKIFPQPLSPRIANYDIDVKLDLKKRMLNGHEKVKWFNKSNDVINELQFHLYLNAFRNNKSTFMKELGGSMRLSKMDKDGWGFIDVTSIKFPSGEDLLSKIEFIHPDDDNVDDKTVFHLLLPKSMQPGDSIIFNIDFVAVLPQPPFARTGAKEEYFFVGQWFPKVGVYIDSKWNCHQYHKNSEFFADFGVYNVKITVPEKNIVGATGLESEVKNNGDGTATHFYHAEDVHDFAWTTSPEFVEFKGKVQDVDIRVLMQPDHAYQGTRHLEAAKVAVEYHQNWYGDYPYPNLTVVDPRRDAGGSGGMEYPTLISAGTTYGLPDGLQLVEMVIIHEFGHNYWYHLLASNEFEESWLDEGINSYTENQIIADHYGTDGNMLDCLGIKINDLQFQCAQYISGPDLDPTIRNAWQYYNGGSYGINSYMKPTLFLTTLQNYLGKETMQKIMRTYSERLRFKHPKTQDFISIANEVAAQSVPPHLDEPEYAKAQSSTPAVSFGSKQNLDWFFNQALYSNATLDYSVDVIKSTEVQKEKGYDFTFSTEDTIAGKEIKEGIEDKDSTTLFLNEINVRRLGSFKFPVEVEIIFEQGEKIREKWDGQELWKKFRYITPVKVISATVDPDHKIPLDVNYSNNSKTVKTQTSGLVKLSAHFLFWVQFIIDMPEFLNLLSFFPSIF